MVTTGPRHGPSLQSVHLCRLRKDLVLDRRNRKKTFTLTRNARFPLGTHVATKQRTTPSGGADGATERGPPPHVQTGIESSLTSTQLSRGARRKGFFGGDESVPLETRRLRFCRRLYYTRRRAVQGQSRRRSRKVCGWERRVHARF